MIALLLASLVAAAPVSTPWTVGDLTVSTCSRRSAVQEVADADLVASAEKRLAVSDTSALLEMRGALEGLLARHSDRRRVELCADVVWVNSGDANDALYLQADMVGSVTKATASTSRIEVARNYVVDAAAILAALAIDRGDRDKAAGWLDSGARVAPNDPALLKLNALLKNPTVAGEALQALRSAR